MPDPADWDALALLARRTGTSAERVAAARAALAADARPGAPLVLAAGRPNAGLELFLARWLGPDVAEALPPAAPLVLGADPASVQPRSGRWPTHRVRGTFAGHLIALRADGKPPAEQLAQLSSLGLVDQLLLVIRLGQPLHAKERDIARALAGICATVRVLIVALPSEEPTADDVAEVCAFAAAQMKFAGFDGPRCGGAAVWFADGSTRHGSLADVRGVVDVSPDAVSRGRAGLERAAFLDLLAAVRTAAEAVPVPSTAVVPEDEIDRLTGELKGYLADLGREVLRQTAPGRPADDATLRAYALDAVRGWGAHVGIEGHWMKYVDRLRPGAEKALLLEAEAALAGVTHDPGTAPDYELGAASPLAAYAKRAGVALVAGLAGYFLLAVAFQFLPTVVLPDVLKAALAVAAFLAAAGLGFAFAAKIFRAPHGTTRDAQIVPPSLRGWPAVERRLTLWLKGRLGTRTPSPRDECDALAARLAPPEAAP